MCFTPGNFGGVLREEFFITSLQTSVCLTDKNVFSKKICEVFLISRFPGRILMCSAKKFCFLAKLGCVLQEKIVKNAIKIDKKIS